jgi:hypothetical protein
MYPDAVNLPKNIKIGTQVLKMDDESPELIARIKSYVEKAAHHYERLDIHTNVQHCK